MTTIEISQITIVKTPASAVLAWCSTCLAVVELITPGQAALFLNVALLDICRKVAADEIHVVETANRAFVCLNSLPTKKSENAAPTKFSEESP